MLIETRNRADTKVSFTVEPGFILSQHQNLYKNRGMSCNPLYLISYSFFCHHLGIKDTFLHWEWGRISASNRLKKENFPIRGYHDPTP